MSGTGQRYREQRAALLATVEALASGDFEAGPTLCARWAPRDIVGHLLGLDSALTTYLRMAGRVGAANARIVAGFRAMSREELLERARRWAARPATSAQLAAPLLIGDLLVHHEDITRAAAAGAHRATDLSPTLARAVLREGLLLGGARRLATYRLQPTDGASRPLGRGRPVRGSTATLGLWLAGRDVTGALELG